MCLSCVALSARVYANRKPAWVNSSYIGKVGTHKLLEFGSFQDENCSSCRPFVAQIDGTFRGSISAYIPVDVAGNGFNRTFIKKDDEPGKT